MSFDAQAYGFDVAKILAFGDSGNRPMPLAYSRCSSEEARLQLSRSNAQTLFPHSMAPEAALSGLWLYFGCVEESHALSQELETPEGSFWHGILHRQEPDPGNAGYWFRRVGEHAVFPALLEAAKELVSYQEASLFRLGSKWEPLRFIELCETARQRPGSAEERLASAIQLREWQLLFDYCAKGQIGAA